MTKLSSSLPDGDSNGLAAIARRLVDDPSEVHVVVALVDCKRTTTDTDTGDTEATARIRRIEPILGDDDKELAGKMLRRALERRIGQEVLPFEPEESLRQVFGDVDFGARSGATMPATTDLPLGDRCAGP